MKKVMRLFCVLSFTVVLAAFLPASSAFAAANPYEPFIGLWKTVSFEESRPDGKTGYALNYEIRWIKWHDSKKMDSVDMVGFSKYKNTYEGRDEDYSEISFNTWDIKFGAGSEGKIIFRGTGVGVR
ncbi:MAG: hypothetical protein LBG12_05135 [Synergistaceae bacterium]|nr:hypothetical protein [Synergistaceae bacterium]